MCTVNILGDISLSYLEQLNNISDSINKILGHADYRLANLESPVVIGEAKKISKFGPNIRCNNQGLGFLSSINVDAYTLANNHAGDYGTEGVLQTVQYLDNIHKEYLGIEKYDSKTGQEYPVLRKDLGIKISFVSVCENEFGTSMPGRIGSCGFDARRMQITLDREKAFSDVVIVIFHGGIEHYPFPTPNQKQRYHTLIDQGADAVIGMHSHCPVGYEIYKDKPIVYGTGNFYFPHKYQPLFQSWNYGYIVHLNIEENAKIDFSYTFYKNSYDGKDFEIIDDMWVKRYMEEISTIIKDDEKLQELFNSWVKMRGPQLAGYFDPHYTDDEIKRCCVIKNIMCCEAHCEILKAYFDMIYKKKCIEDFQVKDYSEEISFIKKYISIEQYQKELNEIKYEKGGIKYILWGFGEKLQKTYQNLIEKGIKKSEIQIVDNDFFKQGLFYGDTVIISPQQALNQYRKVKWCICTPNRFFDGIQQQLQGNGVAIQDISLIE